VLNCNLGEPGRAGPSLDRVDDRQPSAAREDIGGGFGPLVRLQPLIGMPFDVPNRLAIGDGASKDAVGQGVNTTPRICGLRKPYERAVLGKSTSSPPFLQNAQYRGRVIRQMVLSNSASGSLGRF
jgi:hypothetical protein